MQSFKAAEPTPGGYKSQLPLFRLRLNPQFKKHYVLDVYAIEGVYAISAPRWLAAEQNPAVNHKRYCVRPNPRKIHR